MPTLVGIAHGFSFPLRYFEVHRLKPDWPAFLDDFQHHWPTDEDNSYVDFAVWESARAQGFYLPEVWTLGRLSRYIALAGRLKWFCCRHFGCR
jgi:hypothetical protein